MRGVTIAVGVAAALALTACNGGVTKPPFLPETITPVATAPTATPSQPASLSPSPSPPSFSTPGPDFDNFRLFAHMIDDAITSQDLDFFSDRVVLTSIPCPYGMVSTCSEGEMISGVVIGLWGSDAFVEPVEELRAAMELRFLDDVRLFALAVSYHQVSGIVDPPGYLAVVNSPTDPGGTTFILEWVPSGDSWTLRSFINAKTPAEIYNGWVSGDCPGCYDYWTPWEGAAP